MDLTTVVGVVGGVIAAASSVSAIVSVRDAKQRARLEDAQLALEVQRAATEKEVLELLLRARGGLLEPTEEVRLQRQYARGTALLDVLEGERRKWLTRLLERGSLDQVIQVARDANEGLRKDLNAAGILADDVTEVGVDEGVDATDILEFVTNVATDNGLQPGSETSAYLPFRTAGSPRHQLLLTPRPTYLHARFRVPEETDVSQFDARNYSKDGFRSIRLTADDVTERAAQLKTLVKLAAEAR